MSEPLNIQPLTPGRRRRFTLEQRQSLLAAAAAPGSSLSEVARRYGVAPSLLFMWKRAMDEGSDRGLEAGEPVVPASVVKHLEVKVRELERTLGKKTMHIEILEEALKLARQKKLLSVASSSSKRGGL